MHDVVFWAHVICEVLINLFVKLFFRTNMSLFVRVVLACCHVIIYKAHTFYHDVQSAFWTSFVWFQYLLNFNFNFVSRFQYFSHSMFQYFFHHRSNYLLNPFINLSIFKFIFILNFWFVWINLNLSQNQIWICQTYK